MIKHRQSEMIGQLEDIMGDGEASKSDEKA